MAALDAVEIKIFGLNVADDDGTTEFGSTAGGSTAYSDDPTVIQTAAWLEGWQDAVIAGTTKRLPVLQDMNSVHYVTTYGLSYLQQEGIGVWLDTKEYRTNSIVKKDGTSELYISLQDSNTNHALSDGAWWQQCGDLQYIPDAALGTAAYVDTGTGSGDIPLIGTSSATDALAGLIEIATDAEIAAGTDPDKAITPLGLASRLVAFRAYRNTSTQTIAASTPTKVQLNAETFDTNGYFDSATNYRFTPLIAGYYQFFGTCNITGITGNRLESMIYKNGSKTAAGSSVGITGTSDMISVVSDLIYMNGSTDYVELYVIQYSSDGNESLQNGSAATFLYGFLIH